jgi:hypothetical protein
MNEVEGRRRVFRPNPMKTRIKKKIREGATRGTTALVYERLHSGLYTGTVQGY